MAAAGSAKRDRPAARRAGLVVDHGEDAVVAPRQHRHVHPLASLEAADEQGAGRRRHRPHLPDPSRVVATGDPGDTHAVHLVGDHVAVADHEAHDPREHPGEPEAVEAPQQLRHRGGGGQHDAGRHAERALHHDVPGRPQPADRQRQTQNLHLLTPPDDGQEEGEGQEGQLDHEPLEHVAQAESGDRRRRERPGRRRDRRPRTPRVASPRRRTRTAPWRPASPRAPAGGRSTPRRRRGGGRGPLPFRARERCSRPRPVPAGARPCGRAAS